MKNILVVGSLNMDFSIQVCQYPKKGETVLGKTMDLISGGKGANQAYAAAKFGGNVSMIGAVGTDSFGKILIDNLKDVGVYTNGIVSADGVPTGNAFVMVESDGNNRIIVIQGANKVIDCRCIDKNIDLINKCDAMIVQLEIPIDTVIYACKLAKKQNKTVILDPAPASMHLPVELYKNIDIIKPNETELAVLTNMEIKNNDDVIFAAEKLISEGVKAVVATLGDKGAMLVSSNLHKYFPAQIVNAVDTTAAGDCFTAAFAVAFDGTNFDTAIEFANKVSSIVITRKGAQSSIPSIDEIVL